jgi:hypothetical protein
MSTAQVPPSIFIQEGNVVPTNHRRERVGENAKHDCEKGVSFSTTGVVNCQI